MATVRRKAERIENQIDVFSKSFTATTVACARCHDHKFDPITSTEYYQLISTIDGVGHGSREVLVEDRAKELAALIEKSGSS